MAHHPFAGRFLQVFCLLPVALLALRCNPGTNAPSEATWQAVFKDLPSGLLSVSGTGPQDVYLVGTDADDGPGPLVVHYDGLEWRRLQTGATGDLWWITAVTIDGDFYVSGEGGLILQFDPQTQTFQRQTTPGAETIFGVWGFSQDDIWAVGGLLGNQEFGGTIWHFDGSSWSIQDLSGLFPNGYPTVFKIWGRSLSEVYAVGAGGLILSYDGVSWTQLANGTTRNPPLFSVYGNGDTVVAVGGFNTGFILEQGEGDFEDRATPGTIQMNGVFVTSDGGGIAVGRELGVAFRTPGGWEVQNTGLPTDLDFHANWIDSEDGLWAVGGNLIANPIDQGVLVYSGPQVIPSVIAEP